MALVHLIPLCLMVFLVGCVDSWVDFSDYSFGVFWLWKEWRWVEFSDYSFDVFWFWKVDETGGFVGHGEWLGASPEELCYSWLARVWM